MSCYLILIRYMILIKPLLVVIISSNNKLIYLEMRPPPIGQHPDQDTLFKAIRGFALSQGYGIILKNASRDRKAYIRYMRSDKPKSCLRPQSIGPKSISLKSRTQGFFKTDCPFRVYLFLNKASQWEIRVEMQSIITMLMI